MSAPAFGLTLQPEFAFLDRVEPIARDLADFIEVTPETMVRPISESDFAINDYGARVLAFGRARGLPFVAHGVSASLATPLRDPRREQRWWNSVTVSHAAFDFRWYTDHSGASVFAGEELLVPLPVPHRAENREATRGRLARIAALVGDSGVENSALYFALFDPLAEADFLAACVAAERTHLLLDLHNVYTSAVNLEFDAHAFLDRLPLEKVIEIHLSGGSWSNPSWLPAGARTLRLDSHDQAIPEEVFALFDHVLPRCPNLRGVTLERMEGTVGDADVVPLRRECERVRARLRGDS